MVPSAPPRRSRAFPFLVGSLVLGVLAVGLIVTAMKRSEKRAMDAAAGVVSGEGVGGAGEPLPEGVVELVVARRDLYVGMPVTAEDVALRRMAAPVAPRTGTFSALDDVVGRTPRERVLADEIVRGERLANPEAGVGLNALVSPGRRGMTIATDTETGLAGLVQPGNHVDVIVTIPPDDPSAIGARWVTETILQDVKVLAVGNLLDVQQARAEEAAAREAGASGIKPAKASAPAARSKPSLTLEVEPIQAEKLALALKRGEIRVVLRSDIDLEQTWEAGMVTASRLIGAPVVPEVAPAPTPAKPPRRRRRRRNRRPAPVVQAAPAPAPKPARRAEVIQGDTRANVTFTPDGTAIESVDRTPRER